MIGSQTSAENILAYAQAGSSTGAQAGPWPLRAAVHTVVLGVKIDLHADQWRVAARA